ncbi:MAG: PD40 domain-containing protein [Caldilineaceae bacterium]|nr:PD40 domain-containing protein [Caldilineaceae bacterium]
MHTITARLTKLTGSELNPTWSPDGKFVSSLVGEDLPFFHVKSR